jgi:hypothetical protein
VRLPSLGLTVWAETMASATVRRRHYPIIPPRMAGVLLAPAPMGGIVAWAVGSPLRRNALPPGTSRFGPTWPRRSELPNSQPEIVRGAGPHGTAPFAVPVSADPVRRGHSGRADCFPGRKAPRGESILTKKLYVGNLPFDADADELRAMFTTYGRVLSATLATDRETGRPRGFGFVEMVEGAEEAIQALHQAQFGGRSLTVNEAKPREDRPRSSSGGGHFNSRP